VIPKRSQLTTHRHEPIGNRFGIQQIGLKLDIGRHAYERRLNRLPRTPPSDTLSCELHTTFMPPSAPLR
jgi:hypothetical protein